MTNSYKIELELTRDSLFDEMGLRRLRESYMRDDETSPQERFAYVAKAFASNQGHAERLYRYLSKHQLSASTPILSYGVSKKALPISCYLAYIDDSASGLVNTMAEVAWLSVLGGGVGLGMGMRSEDDKSVGVMPHLKTYEAVSLAYRQGKTRRGSFAAYLSIDHPNIMQFIDMRKSTGDANLRCQELHHGINITDKFMLLIEQSMLDDNFDDSWSLVDPHTKEIKDTVSARKLWENILETRMRTGEPYLHFIDESNRQLPQFQKDFGLKVTQSNICTEITLATNEFRTAVCCLASLNLEYWDEWKDNYLFYKDVAEMLDNALTIFIRDAPEKVERAVYSAQRERSIGVGVLGFHALLQQRGIPFESALASSLNHQIFQKFEEHLFKANRDLGFERGECPDGEGYGIRFSHTRAIAPNASSSILMGNTSPSIEPFRANAYRQDTISGSFLKKNKYLEKALEFFFSEPEQEEEVWSSIVSKAGSVQHLEWLPPEIKEVFKTASELDQNWIIQHAADRQPHIDQAQSVNLFFKANAAIEYIHHVHFMAWKKKLKTLYYCRSDKLYSGDSMNRKVERIKMKSIEEDCLACQ